MRVFLRKKIDIVGPDAAGYRDTPSLAAEIMPKKQEFYCLCVASGRFGCQN
jgi:hypothetical protein